MKRGIWWEIAG